MKHLSYLCLATLISISCKTPGVSTEARSKQPAFPAVENALLWEITGKGLTKPSYLYGTIHMICEADMQLGDSLQWTFGQSEKLFLEIDMDDPGMAMKTLQWSMMKKGSIKDLVSPASYEQLSRFMKDSIQMPMMIFNKMKPLTLMSLFYTKMLPCAKTKSFEEVFMAMAVKQQKELLGLEKIEDQFGVFDKIPDSVEAVMLMDIVQNFPEKKKEFQKMVTAYTKADLRTLGGLMEESPEIKGYEDLFLANRNRNWIPVMTAAMASNPCFFAVGAGHLPGPEGVITLLRQSGYSLRPITDKN